MQSFDKATLQQLYNKLEQLKQQKNWTNFFTVLNQMITIEPTADLCYQKGSFLLRTKHYYQAIASFERCLALDPQYKQAHQRIAQAQEMISLSSEISGQLKVLDSQEVQMEQFLGIPKNFGRYQVIKELGRGGMGKVYLVKDPKLKREVALKTILEKDENSVKRLIQESRAMARLAHQYIVKIYDIGEVAEIHYFTMDFIAGKNLKEWLQKEKVTVRRGVEIIRKMTQAIDYAHQHGILHRDIKPANIMINDDDEPMVMDFGLAREIGENTMISKTGEAIGTPAYMSPEQAYGKRKEIDERSDVYSLGVVLYELLTGRQPFVGSTHEILLQVADKNPLSPSQISRKIPKDIENITLKAMAKEKKLRYQSAYELTRDLERFLNGEPVLAVPLRWGYKLQKWMAKNLAITVLVVFFFIASIVGTMISYWQIRQEVERSRKAEEQAKQAEIRAREAEKQTKSERDNAREAEKKAMKRLVFSYLEKADRYWQDGEKQYACLLYSKAISEEKSVSSQLAQLARRKLFLRFPELPRYRGKIDLLTDFPQLKNLQIIIKKDLGIGLVFSPDGKYLAWTGSDGRLYLWDRHGNKLSKVIKGHKEPVTSMDFSPDGNTIASGGMDNYIKLWDVKSGRRKFVLKGHRRSIRTIAFSPNGKMLASGSGDTTIKIWQVSTKKLLATLAGHRAGVTSLAFGVYKEVLASASEDKTICLWNIDTMKLRKRLIPATTEVHKIAINPEGRILASLGFNEIIFWDIHTGDILSFLRGHFQAIRCLAFSPNGEFLITGGNEGTVRLWDVESQTIYGVCKGHFSPVVEVAFSPDGKNFASLAESLSIRLWKMNSTKALRGINLHRLKNSSEILNFHMNAVRKVAFNTNGKILASVSADHTVRLWDTNEKKVFKTIRRSKGLHCVQFSPNDRFLAFSYRMNLELWDISKNKRYVIFRDLGNRIPSKAIVGISFNPDGHLIASVQNDRQVKLWDIHNKTPHAVLTGARDIYFNCVAFAPDGSVLVSGGTNGGIVLWDVKMKKAQVISKEVAGWITSVDFHPQGKIIAASSVDNSIYLWEIATGKCISILKGHEHSVNSVKFSPDGKVLVSAGNDKTIRLWDIDTKRTIMVKRGHLRAVLSVAFSPTGKMLASGSTDLKTGFWDILGAPEFLELSPENIEKRIQQETGLRLEKNFLVAFTQN